MHTYTVEREGRFWHVLEDGHGTWSTTVEHQAFDTAARLNHNLERLNA